MKRDQTLDIVKGLAIIAIVFGHVWRGLYNGGVLTDQLLFEAIDRLTYMWHLSVFAFTAGLFVERGMRRHGSWKYVWRRDAGFLWLYLIWTLIQGALEVAASSLANTPTHWSDVLKVWLPTTQLWFLGWLAIMLAVTAALQPWISHLRQVAFLALLAITSLASWGLNGDLLGTKGMGISIFFAAGLLIGGERLTSWLAALKMWVVLGSAIAALGAYGALTLFGDSTPPTMSGDTRTVISVALGVAASSIATVGVLLLARLLDIARVFGVLARLGRQSMTIFLGHVLFQSGSRIVLSAVGIESLAIHMVVGILGAVICPLFLAAIAKRLRLGWLFESPGWLTRLTAH